MLDLSLLRAGLNREIGKRDLLLSQIEEQKARKEEIERSLFIAKEGYEIITEAVATVQNSLKFSITGMVSKALELVFEDPYTFGVDFVYKRGQMECELYLMRDGIRFGLLDEVGFGGVDVCSFVLRLSLFSLMRDRAVPVMVFDEPFKHLSSEYQPKVGELIHELSAKMGIQFIILSHRESVIEKGADKIFKVCKNKKITGVIVGDY